MPVAPSSAGVYPISRRRYPHRERVGSSSIACTASPGPGSPDKPSLRLGRPSMSRSWEPIIVDRSSADRSGPAKTGAVGEPSARCAGATVGAVRLSEILDPVGSRVPNSRAYVLRTDLEHFCQGFEGGAFIDFS